MYEGIYIAASLLWLWVAERQRPNPADLIGAAIAIAGALVIIGVAARIDWRDAVVSANRGRRPGRAVE